METRACRKLIAPAYFIACHRLVFVTLETAVWAVRISVLSSLTIRAALQCGAANCEHLEDEGTLCLSMKCLIILD